MRSKLIITAALLCCLSCVRIDAELGGNLVPIDQQYEMYSCEVPITDMQMLPTDSLSGFSQKRLTIGAIRDSQTGLCTRQSLITIVPVYDTVDFGNIQKIYSFFFDAAFDTVSVPAKDQKHILQNVYVHELSKGMSIKNLTDCNDIAGCVKTDPVSIVAGTPVLDGSSDLIFKFTEDYAWKVANAANGKILSQTFDEYLQEVPGICISTNEPAGNGGRYNLFDCQLGYNSSSYSLDGTYAALTVSSIFEGSEEAVDTTFMFYYGLLEYADADSLISNSSSGSYPQYAFNLTKHESRAKAGTVTTEAFLEGGGGLKPVISAESLKNNIITEIRNTLEANGVDPEIYKDAIVNKASILLPYTPCAEYDDMDYFPSRITPTCKIQTDTSTTFMGLTDSSDENANQGDVNYSLRRFEPDVSYHIQQLLQTTDTISSAKLHNYDIWMLIMGQETTTSSSSSSSDLSEYYQYLAYQSYYNSMYGGYGSYSGYGYGSSYNNYYSYMMAAMYASSSSTSTSTDYELDTDRYYKGSVHGPLNEGAKPSVKITFSVPK